MTTARILIRNENRWSGMWDHPRDAPAEVICPVMMEGSLPPRSRSDRYLREREI